MSACKIATITALIFALGTPLAAQSPDRFRTGPVFEEFGPVADVPDADVAIPEDASFHVAFDVARAAQDGQLDRGFESAARLINMHARAGVAPMENRAAVVVHGAAVFDLLSAEGWAAHDREDANGSAAMVREMLDHGVRFIVCGQSAAAQGITADQLIEGVEMDLSAMTAHALLQQRGYTVNPF